MTKTAVVFGGAGFIGSHLLKALVEEGGYDSIVSADIRPPRFAVEGVRYATCDVREPIPDALCASVTEIYNLAAVHTTPGHEDWEYYWTNVLGATHICDYARRNGVSAVLFTSSIAVYGPSESSLDERSPLAPEIAYGKSKLCAEKIHQLWHAEQPQRRKLVVVRPAVIYGFKEAGNFTRLANLLRRRRFVFPGRKDTIKSCGYVTDLVRSFRFMLNRPEQTIIYNFAHQERFTSEDICAAYVRVAGYRRPTLVMPIALMRLIGVMFELAGKFGLKTSINRARIMKLYRSTNIVPRILQEMGFNYRFDLDASLRDWMKMSPEGQFD